MKLLGFIGCPSPCMKPWHRAFNEMVKLVLLRLSPTTSFMWGLSIQHAIERVVDNHGWMHMLQHFENMLLQQFVI